MYRIERVLPSIFYSFVPTLQVFQLQLTTARVYVNVYMNDLEIFRIDHIFSLIDIASMIELDYRLVSNSIVAC